MQSPSMSIPRFTPAVLILLLCLTDPGLPAAAQFREPETPRDTSSLDARLLLAIYGIDNPAFGATMYAADAIAYPVFYGAVPAAWAGAALLRDETDYTDAYLLTLSFAATYVTSTYLKDLVRRPRPRIGSASERVRDPRQEAREDSLYRYSMPSGHAAIAFTLASSYGLSHPEWYVLAPGLTWATGTALSRVWRGRHYPGDVVGGMILGAAIAGALHLVRDHVTPAFLRANGDDDAEAAVVMVRLRLGAP